VESKGELPEPKRRHSCVFYKKKLFVFGGFCDFSSQHLNDLDVFDTGTSLCLLALLALLCFTFIYLQAESKYNIFISKMILVSGNVFLSLRLALFI